MRKASKLLLVSIGFLLGCLANAHAGNNAENINTLNLASDTSLSSAGYFRLNWQSQNAKAEAVTYLLEEAQDAQFSSARTLYAGPDTATLISGRSNGTYFYRVTTHPGADAQTQHIQWSNVAKVEVTHHPLSRAFMFFILGALVFIATAVVIIAGNKSQRQ